VTAGKRILIALTADDCKRINEVLSNANATAHQHARARILKMSGEKLTSTTIADELHVSAGYISRVRREFIEGGVERVLFEGSLRTGAPTQIPQSIVDDAAKLHARGVSFRELADKFGFSHAGMRYAISRRREVDDGNRGR
jgi:hypothetical protein